MRVQCTCFWLLEAGQWLLEHTPRTGHGQLNRARGSSCSLSYPTLLPPADLGVGCRSHRLTQMQENTSNRFAQLLLAGSKLWKHFEGSRPWLHPIRSRSGAGSARYTAGERQTYSTAKVKGNGLSLSAALEPKSLSFRSLTASMRAWNKRGSHTFSPLVPVGMTEDQICIKHKTWLKRALSLRRSPHYYTAPERKTQFRTQTFELLRVLKG